MDLLGKKIIGMDIHDYSAEIVEISYAGKKATLESFNRTQIPEDVIVNGEITDEEKLRQILLDLLKDSNPKPVMTKNAAIIFPSSKVLTHIFTFPANLKEEEIRKAIPYEAETVIPFSFDDIYWDFTLLESELKEKKHSTQYVFFACITKDVADKYARILEMSGLNPMVFGINAEALKYATLKQTKKDMSTMILDVGTLSVDYLLMKNGVIRSFFSSNESGHKLAAVLAQSLRVKEDEIVEKKEMDRLHALAESEQIVKFIEHCYKRGQKIIEEYENESFREKIEEVILTGDFLNLPHFHAMAKKYFSGREVVIADPKVNLVINNKKFTKRVEGEKKSAPYSIYFAYAIGIALKGILKPNSGINLLPDKLKENLSRRRNHLLIAIAAILMCVFSVTIAISLLLRFYEMGFERRTLEIKKSSIQTIIFGSRYKQIYDEITAFNTEINDLSRIDKGLFSIPDTLHKIFGYIPEGIDIVSWNFSDNDLTFGFSGIADGRDALLKLQSNFEQCEFVSEVKSPISNFDAKQSISFSLLIKLNFTKLACYGTDPQ